MTERLDVSMAALGRALGFVPPERAPWVNSTDQNAIAPTPLFQPAEPEPVKLEIEAELDSLTRLDRLVYKAAIAGMP